MAILYFVITAGGGTAIIVITLRRALAKGANDHILALITATGLTFTFLFSFFIALLAPGVEVEIDALFVFFWGGLSVFHFILAYGIMRVLARYLPNRES